MWRGGGVGVGVGCVGVGVGGASYNGMPDPLTQ